jgi:homoserine O-acetyltransferase/O-succinyltransferase
MTSGDRTHRLGRFTLESGVALPEAWIAYKTHGTLNAEGSNAVLYPTQFAAQHGDVEWMIGPDRALDPRTHFIVVADQLGNGLSSSPSNTPPPHDRARFPVVTIRDDVAAQHRLLTDGLGLRRLKLVAGYSMGAQQAFQWAVSHPGFVERNVAFCGTARTTAHNAVFLESLRTALTSDAAWQEGDYASPPRRGLRALATIYASWGFSQDFYNRGGHRQLGFSSIADCISGFWEARYAKRDANNLLSMIRTWELNDAGSTPGMEGSLARALGSIRARCTVIASRSDLYFRPADLEAEARMIPGARFVVIPSDWGHMAGAGINPEDSAFLTREIQASLAA